MQVRERPINAWTNLDRDRTGLVRLVWTGCRGYIVPVPPSDLPSFGVFNNLQCWRARLGNPAFLRHRLQHAESQGEAPELVEAALHATTSHQRKRHVPLHVLLAEDWRVRACHITGRKASAISYLVLCVDIVKIISYPPGKEGSSQ